EWGITREDQDRYALESHRRAIEAWDKGIYDDEVMPFPVPPSYRTVVERDTVPRPDSSMEKLAALKPVFDRKYGSITAGSSSPLTDGAAALLIMSEEAAQRLGYEPKAYLRAYASSAVDPNWQLLIGPALSTPVALDRAGLT